MLQTALFLLVLGAAEQRPSFCQRSLLWTANAWAKVRRALEGPSTTEIFAEFAIELSQILDKPQVIELSPEVATDRYDSLVILKAALLEFGNRHPEIRRIALKQLKEIALGTIVDATLSRLNSPTWVTEQEKLILKDVSPSKIEVVRVLAHPKIIQLRFELTNHIIDLRPQWIAQLDLIKEQLQKGWVELNARENPLRSLTEVISDSQRRSEIFNAPTDAERLILLSEEVVALSRDLITSPNPYVQDAGKEIEDIIKKFELYSKPSPEEVQKIMEVALALVAAH